MIADQASAGPQVIRGARFVQVLQLEEGVAYVTALQFAEWLASLPTPPPVATTSRGPQAGLGSAGGGGSLSASQLQGDCYAGPIPAYIVTRESGGDPGAVNASSGAYGCFQIMPFVWDANCGDLDRGVGGQIACADRISNGGTNLRPWAF